MKKLLSFALTLCLLLTLITPLALAEEKAELTFLIWDKNQQAGMQAIIDAYTAKNPNVSINLQVIPWSEYWTKLQAAAEGGALPDIFWIHANQFFVYAEAGVLLDLTPAGVDYSPYPEGITAMYNYEGKQLAVPKDYDTIALAYNKEIFDKAGIAYPDDTWTWETLLETAKKLTDPEKGIYGYGAPITDQSGFNNFIYQNDGFTFRDGKSGFDQPATQEAIKFYTDFVLAHGVSPTPESFADLRHDDQFMAGKLAMLNVGSWMMSAYTTNDDIKDKFDLAVLPKGKSRSSQYNGLGYAGAANTKHPEAVLDFIKFAGSEEANILQAQHKAAIPAYKGTEKYFTEQFPNINIDVYPQMLEYGQVIPYSPHKALWTDYETETITAIYTGEYTVESACMAIHEKILEAEQN